jgi:hypothetical protein
MASRKSLKGGFSFSNRQNRLVDVRAGAGDGHSEHQHQAALIEWRDWTLRLIQHDPEVCRALCLFSVPNGADLAVTQRAKMDREGRMKGVSDLFLRAGRHGYHGLFIEMKTPKGRLTDEQKKFIEDARAEGYRAEVCRSWQEAARLVVEYLGLERHAPIRD